MRKINLSNRRFSANEYEALRQEMNFRLDVIYGHGFTLASVILIFFSLILVFVAEILKIVMQKDSIFGQFIYVDLMVIFSIACFSVSPVLLVFSFSVKYKDNLRQICNISAYQTVFFEFPSLLFEASSEDIKGGIIGWEFFQRDKDIPGAKWIASEYVAIAIMSLVLSVLLAISLTLCSCLTNSNRFFDSEHFVSSILTLSVVIILYIAIVVLIIFLIIKIRNNTFSDKIIQQFIPKYKNEYLDLAVKYHLFDSSQVKQLKAVLNNGDKDGDSLTKKGVKKCQNKRKKIRQLN